MVFTEILNEINNKESNTLRLLEESKEILDLRKILEAKSLLLCIEIQKSGSLINNDYYSQICLTVYDKENNDVFLNDEPNMSMEIFSEIVIQKKNKINISDINENIEFWDDLNIMKNNVLSNNFHIN